MAMYPVAILALIKVVVFSVGGCYSNKFLVLQAPCCIQSGSILYFLEATPTLHRDCRSLIIDRFTNTNPRLHLTHALTVL